MQPFSRTLASLFLTVWTVGGCDRRTPPTEPAVPPPAPAVAPEKAPVVDAPAAKPAAPEPPPTKPSTAKPAAVEAAVERVAALGGKVRYDGARVVGVQVDATPARDDDVKLLAGLTDLEQLVLRGEGITDVAAGQLAGLTKLTHLSLEGTSITDGGVARLKQLAGLQRLNLSRTPAMTDAALAHLAELPDLQYLELLDNKIGDAALAHLKPLDKLHLLDLRGCQRLSDAGLAHLAGRKSLRALRLRSPAIGDSGLAQLADLTSLAELSVEDSSTVTDEGLKVLVNFRGMTSLRISRCPRVGDRGLAPLADMPKLRLLFLRDTRITGACLEYVKDAEDLRRIDLAETVVGDDALAHLRGTKNLEWLSLWKTRVTVTGMQHLAGLPKLTYLRLAETAVGDKGLAEIAKIESLEELDLEQLRISDAGLAQLKNLKNLKRLNIAMVDVSDEAVAALQAAIPKLQVLRWHWPGGWPLSGVRCITTRCCSAIGRGNKAAENACQTASSGVGCRHVGAALSVATGQLSRSGAILPGGIVTGMPSCSTPGILANQPSLEIALFSGSTHKGAKDMVHNRSVTQTVIAIVAACLLSAPDVCSAADKAEEGFVSLFDGKTLNGWHLMNGAKFVAEDGVLKLNGGPGWLRSDKEYSDLVLHLELRFMKPNQDGGVFLRSGIEGKDWPDRKYEVQCQNTLRMGMIFGAPHELRVELAQKALKPVGEWNAYDIKLIGSSIEVRLNGELVSTSDKMDALKRGYLGLQGENGFHEYRNFRIKDLSK